ncbi:MAG: amidohydrolase [Phyllobacteriaceae bacterium]|nr:amidohydrolase [Phyllobacteriaceae bacterium]
MCCTLLRQCTSPRTVARRRLGTGAGRSERPTTFEAERSEPLTDRSIATLIRERHQEHAELRREIHRNPEFGFKEFKTSRLVADRLKSWGLMVCEGIAETGVVATLTGGEPGPSIGLRADMDALRINEVPGRPHCSCVPGMMHACGHDGHTTMLLAAAQYLAGHREEVAGTVHFIFQPAEEGLGGAPTMMREGLFERFPVEAVYGMHNMPGIPAGELHTRPGPLFAASDMWSVTFHGTGGHGGGGAHKGTDPTLVQAHFITALHSVVSRNVAPDDMAVLSVGHIAAGAAESPSVIPSTATVVGTGRSYTPKVRDTIERRLRQLAEAQAVAFGCTAEVIYDRRFPPLVPAQAETDRSIAAAARVVGAAKVDGASRALTYAEDFAHMLEAKPGGFMLIGNGMPADGFTHLHTDTYDFNDDVIPIGAGYWVELVRSYRVA